MRSCFALFTCLLVLAATPLAADDPGNPIGHGLWRISGSSPSFPQSELEPLRQIVGGAEFVGVGEAIHTSGGFYEMKDRIFRYLVEQMGFRALGMETGFIRADRVEQYIQTGQGTAEAAAMPFITVVWRSNEVLAMVKWMREWNVAHPDDRVHFYGFDIQAQALANATAVIDVLHAMGITDDDSRITGIHACDGVDAFYFLDGLPYPPELYQQCDAALTATAAYFDANEKEIERVTSADTLAYARVHLVGQQTWQEEIFYYDDGMRSGRARDRGMAYVAQALRDGGARGEVRRLARDRRSCSGRTTPTWPRTAARTRTSTSTWARTSRRISATRNTSPSPRSRAISTSTGPPSDSAVNSPSRPTNGSKAISTRWCRTAACSPISTRNRRSSFRERRTRWPACRWCRPITSTRWCISRARRACIT